MIDKQLADKLTGIAIQQLAAGKKLKEGRMTVVREIEDLYNNKVMAVGDGRVNIPLPFLSSYIDTLMSKIDNPPTVTFKIPNRPILSDKVAAAFKMDSSSMRGSWPRKDREEKKFSLLSGRGIASIFASSVGGKYKSHYNVVDHLSFVCEGTRGHLDEMLYKGEEGIWKTKARIEDMAKEGIYDPNQVGKLLAGNGGEDKTSEEQKDKIDRMEALGLTPDHNAYVGQKVHSLVQWCMNFEGEEYYLVFDPKTQLWLRAEKLKDVFACNKSPYVSWATGGGNSAIFWDKGPADDMLPVAEAMRLILNETIENARRANRPMRIIQAGDFPDPNELMDYMPDNVIVTNQGKKGEIVTIETPQLTASVDLVQYLNNLMGEKTGVAGQGVDETDATVGVYYGQLQQEADRIGIINKAYSESYAEKGYRYFWALKEHLSEKKAIEMLGKGGIVWAELDKTELADVDDVDDVICSGGAREEQANALLQKAQSDALASLTGNAVTLAELNPRKVIKATLKAAGWGDEDVQEFLDRESDPNQELMNEADEAIQEILLGKTPRLNRGANVAFMQRILDWDVDNLNYVKLNAQGQEIGIDEKMFETHNRLIAYMQAHQQVVVDNIARELRTAEATMGMPMAEGGRVQMPVPGRPEQQAMAARPFENPMGTPEGTAAASQRVSQTVTP